MQVVHSTMRSLHEEHTTSLSKIGDLATELERYGVDLLSNTNVFKGTLSQRKQTTFILVSLKLTFDG